MPNGWLDRQARQRYARSFKDILAVRNDARGVACQLQDALPGLAEENLGIGCTSGIYDCEAWIGGHAPVTANDRLMAAAAELGGQEFWFAISGDGTVPKKSFTVIVVENRPMPPDAGADAPVEVPAFLTAKVAATTAVSVSEAVDDSLDEDEPEIEVDCHE
jgi:hypothetical protein